MKDKISFDDFKNTFENLVKDKQSKVSNKNNNYKDVDLHTFGDQSSGVRIAEILNEFRDVRYRKKSLKFIHFSNLSYQEIGKIKDRRLRIHLATVFHTERKTTLHRMDLPPVLRNHMYAYIVGKFRNIVNQ